MIAKIRELADGGDRAAVAKMAEFESAIANGDVVAFQRLENNMIETALKEFELVSHREAEDLRRLQMDRNFCAHPGYVALDNLFSPSSELVRAHIVHALQHLLIQMPVQGKAAVEKAIKAIVSPWFPTDVLQARKVLEDRFIGRARESVVLNLLLVLLKGLFVGGDPTLTGKEEVLSVAFGVLTQTHPAAAKMISTQRVHSMLLSCPDSQALLVCSLVTRAPEFWDWLPSSARIRTQGAIASAKPDALMRSRAFSALFHGEIRQHLLKRVDDLPMEDKWLVLEAYPQPEFVDDVVGAFAKSGSFRYAEATGNSLLLYTHLSTEDHMKRVLEAVQSNGQILYAAGMPDVLRDLFRSTHSRLPGANGRWRGLVGHIKPIFNSEVMEWRSPIV